MSGEGSAAGGDPFARGDPLTGRVALVLERVKSLDSRLAALEGEDWAPASSLGDGAELITRLRAVQGVSFRWRDDAPGHDGEEDAGVIAQDVREAFPELVGEGSGG